MLTDTKTQLRVGARRTNPETDEMAKQTLAIQAGTTTIDKNAHRDKEHIDEVAFPDSLVHVGVDAFLGCHGIQRLDLSTTSVTTIGEGAFEDCAGLVTVRLPRTLQTLGHGVFWRCDALTEVDLSGTRLASIGEWAFRACRQLTAVTFPPTCTAIESRAFCECDGLTAVDLPAGMTTIGEHAFYRSTSLVALRIPASIRSIGPFAFAHCSALTAVVIDAAAFSFDSNPFGNTRQFLGCTALSVISVPDREAAARWPDGVFLGCPTPLPAMLAASPPSVQLKYYWKPGRASLSQCAPNAREVVYTVLLVAARLMHRWFTQPALVRAPPTAGAPAPGKHAQPLKRMRLVAANAQHGTAHSQPTAVLSDLPDEIWFCILSLLRRHELGRAAANPY